MCRKAFSIACHGILPRHLGLDQLQEMTETGNRIRFQEARFHGDRLRMAPKLLGRLKTIGLGKVVPTVHPIRLAPVATRLVA